VKPDKTCAKIDDLSISFDKTRVIFEDSSIIFDKTCVKNEEWCTIFDNYRAPILKFLAGLASVSNLINDLCSFLKLSGFQSTFIC
jgi:hypothetical protein